MGRPVASLAGFDYSEVLVTYGGTWTPNRFYAFALSPALTVPGTYMDFFQNVYDVIVKGDKQAVKPEEARNVIKIIELAFRSAKTGSEMKFNE